MKICYFSFVSCLESLSQEFSNLKNSSFPNGPLSFRFSFELSYVVLKFTKSNATDEIKAAVWEWCQCWLHRRVSAHQQVTFKTYFFQPFLLGSASELALINAAKIGTTLIGERSLPRWCLVRFAYSISVLEMLTFFLQKIFGPRLSFHLRFLHMYSILLLFSKPYGYLVSVWNNCDDFFFSSAVSTMTLGAEDARTSAVWFRNAETLPGRGRGRTFRLAAKVKNIVLEEVKKFVAIMFLNY